MLCIGSHAEGVKMPRRTLVLLIMLAMVIIVAAPALADVSKGGTHHCATGETPYSRSFSSQWTYHDPPPGGGYEAFYNGSSMMVREALGSGTGGAWEVRSTGSLNSSGTFADCHPWN